MKKVFLFYLCCIAAGLTGLYAGQVPANAAFETRKAEIMQRWNELRPAFSGEKYDAAPSSASPFRAGKVNDALLQDGVNMLNFFRFLVDLPDDVLLKTDYTELAQHGSVLNAAWKHIAHSQAQPTGMAADFYAKASKGIGSSNLHQGCSSLSDAVMGWMDDSDDSNIDRLGHRRWVLNPNMQYTGLGFVDGYSSMYGFDSSRQKAVSYSYVAFPSGAAYPADFFGARQAWHVSLNPALYQTPKKANLTVTLTDVSGGKKYTFSPTKSAGYFTVETSNYGIPNCIIFRPDNIKDYNGTYRVEIAGLKDSKGKSVNFSYETTFFAMGGGSESSTSQPTASGTSGTSGTVSATSAADFEYKVVKQGNASAVTITKYKGVLRNVVIPETINGAPVTTIASEAFVFAKIATLTFPATLVTIEDKACWCAEMTSLVILANVQRIGKQAFSFCPNLVSVTLPNSSTLRIDDFAFYKCPLLETAPVPAAVKQLGYGVFQDCPKLVQSKR